MRVVMREGTLLVGLLSLVLSAGCGGGGASGDSSASPASPPTTTPTTTPTNLPVIASFAPKASGNALNESNSLTWDVSNATSLSIDQGVGTVKGTSASISSKAVGTVTYTLSATNADGTNTAQTKVVTWPATVGLSADRPPFLMQSNGGFNPAWGAGGWWPEVLFWPSVSKFKDQLTEILAAADSIESSGTPPTIGLVSWGFDLEAANGGSTTDGIADYSQKGGFIQYAGWEKPRAADYFALNEQGQVAYPNQGYISMGMPMTDADAEFAGQLFGQWAGKRVGQLALDIHCRGLTGADGFIGLNYFTDWHPRLIAAFEKWSGLTVPAGTTADRRTWILSNHGNEWWDFQAHNQSSFYATFGKTLLDAGKTPRVGGQWPSYPAFARFTGNDPRIWAQHLDPSLMLFYVEIESAGDRDTPPEWTAVACLGATACRTPEVPIGAFLDASIQDYWDAVSRAGLTKDEGWKFLKHEWLSAAWTHLANRDGSVRRAAQVLVRSFWDAGDVDPDVVQAYLAHIPKHPFGPAIYYSVPIERAWERIAPGYTYNQQSAVVNSLKTASSKDVSFGVLQGLNVGYWVSDAANLDGLPAANKPSAWVVFDSDKLPSAEKTALQAIAPVLDPAKDATAILSAGPIRATGSGLSCLAFVDQNGSVMVMVSNINNDASQGTLQFKNVGNGTFACNGLLGTPNATLQITGNTGSIPITVAGRDSLVFEIPKLKWIAH